MPRRNKTASEKNSDLAERAREVRTSCFARSARSVARKLIAAYDAHLAPHELSLPQFVVLLTIAGARDRTLAAIAEAADIDPSTLTRNLQLLERNGLVEVAAIDADLRRRGVQLTDAGARRLAAAIPAWEAAQADMEQRLSASFLPAMQRAEKAL